MKTPQIIVLISYIALLCTAFFYPYLNQKWINWKYRVCIAEINEPYNPFEMVKNLNWDLYKQMEEIPSITITTSTGSEVDGKNSFYFLRNGDIRIIDHETGSSFTYSADGEYIIWR
jgi:hypothetical protein